MTRREKTDRLERVGTIYMDENEQLVYKLDHLRPTSNDWRLTDAWMDEHALLGAVYRDPDIPIEVYSSQKAIDELLLRGYTESEAVEEVKEWSGERQVLWAQALRKKGRHKLTIDH